MDEWEEEFEQVQTNTVQATNKEKVEESEDIIKKEFKPVVVEKKRILMITKKNGKKRTRTD